MLYVAEEDHLAFAETLLRDLELDALQRQALAIRSLAAIRVTEPLSLAQFDGPGLRKLKARADVVHGPHPLCGSWSQAIHGHPDRVDGIAYRARHDKSGLALALFVLLVWT